MDLATALSYFAVVAAFGTVAGVVAVSRYPAEPFSVPLARLTLLLGAGFMLWLGWTCYNDLPDRPLLNWAVAGLGLVCGATFGGYCGDMARTAVIGEPTPEQRRQLDCVVEMFEASRALLRPGTGFGEIHDAAVRAAETRGFRHELGSGHSIGVQNHEVPDIAAGATAVLEPNMVVALEPLLIVPGVGGVRLEDTFLITEDGAEPLMAEPLRQWA